MKVDLIRLKKKPDFMSVNDMLEVFSTCRTTLRKYELKSIDGFPKSATLLGRKGWFKDDVLKYIATQQTRSAKQVALMQRGRITA